MADYNFINGTVGADNLAGTPESDSISGAPPLQSQEDAGDSIRGLGGDDALYGEGGNDNLDGGSGNDALFGDTGSFVAVTGPRGDDTLYGGDGDDELRGGPGADLLEGGAGNDRLYGGIGRINGDNDTAVYASATSGVTVNLSLTSLQDTIGAGHDYLWEIDNLLGSAYSDALTGNDRANTLNGGGGSDILLGGKQNDTYILRDLRPTSGGYAYDTVVELADEGFDTVKIDHAATWAVTSYTLGANVEAAVDEGATDFNLIGNGLDNRLTGGSGANRLNGGTGNDTLEGGAGRDVLIGGVGNDSYILKDIYRLDPIINRFVFDQVVENPGEGTDIVFVQRTGGVTSYVLPAGIENGSVTGSAAFDLFGNDAANTFYGNQAMNLLDGRGGDDTLTDPGGGGSIMIGGQGNDTLKGGAGADTASYADAPGGIAVDLADMLAQDTGAAGIDTLSSIENVIGSAFDDILGPSSQANVIDGRAGIDLADYSAGNQGAVIYLDGSGTNDRDALGDSLIGVENIAGSAAKGDRLIGDGADNELSGLGGADRLDGGGGRDTLDGGDGDDVLLGRTGADRLTGGVGADIFAIVDKLPVAGEHDRVMDFLPGQDRLQVDASQFGGGLLTGGGVDLVIGASPDAAGHAGGTFLYDTDDGYLRFDADGGGSGGGVLLWVLQGAPAIAATDFLIVA